MGWLHRVPDAGTAITNYVFDSTTGHTVYTLGAAVTWQVPFGVPQKVSVEFPLSRSPLDGVQIVIPQTPTSCVTAKPRPAAPFTVQGQLHQFTQVFVHVGEQAPQGPLGTVVGQNPVGRKRGRPLLVGRGRSVNRARW